MSTNGAQAWLDACFPKQDAEARANEKVQAERVKGAAAWQKAVDSVAPSISFAGDADSAMGRRAAKQPETQLAAAPDARLEAQKPAASAAPVEQSSSTTAEWKPSMPWHPSITYPTPERQQP